MTMDMERRIDEWVRRTKPRSKPRPEWTPPSIEDFAWEMTVQAFDQTLTNIGYVQFMIIKGEVRVADHRTIRPKPSKGLDSFTYGYEQASLLGDEVDDLLLCSSEVVFEMPAVTGYRIDSSKMAGQAIYDRVHASRFHYKAVMVSKNHAATILTGNKDAGKPEMAEAVARYAPETVSRKWNEHQRDALALGLAHLYDVKKRELVA